MTSFSFFFSFLLRHIFSQTAATIHAGDIQCIVCQRKCLVVVLLHNITYSLHTS